MTMLTVDEARTLTDSIRADLTSAVAKLQRARELGAHTALGYDSWHGFVTVELGDLLRELHLPVDERRALVASMAEAGKSVRETAGELSVSKSTVQNDRKALASVTNLDERRPAEASPPAENDASRTPADEMAPQTAPSSVDLVVAAVERARDGLTVHEAGRRLRWRQGQTSCALSRAEKRGRLVRSGRFRDGCAVYVLPVAASAAA